MLTPDEIEDIITDLSCRNAAGGIYTGSVHPFARAIEKAAEAAAIERCMAAISQQDEACTGATMQVKCLRALRALLPKEES